jgi:hypothetical protein
MGAVFTARTDAEGVAGGVRLCLSLRGTKQSRTIQSEYAKFAIATLSLAMTYLYNLLFRLQLVYRFHQCMKQGKAFFKLRIVCFV